MSLFQRLLEQLHQRGLEVRPGVEPDQLLLCGPTKEKTPEIIKAVKAFKPQLLERFGKREPAPAPEPESERMDGVESAER